MIGKLVAPLLKLLLPKVTQKVTDHLAKIFKLDSVLRYVEMPNDADKKIEKLEARMAQNKSKPQGDIIYNLLPVMKLSGQLAKLDKLDGAMGAMFSKAWEMLKKKQ